MDQNPQTRAVFSEAMKGYAIGALVAVILSVYLSSGGGPLKLEFTYRLIVALGGWGAYVKYKKAVRQQRGFDSAHLPGERPQSIGSGIFLWIGLVVVGGSLCLVLVTAVLYNLVAGGKK